MSDVREIPDPLKSGVGPGTWVARIIMAILVPLALLGLLEGVLRLASAGYSTEFFVPNADRGDYVTNLKFGWRFFPPRVARWPSPQVISRQKSDRAYRIFLLGGSAAYGTPSDLYGFARILEVMLKERFPDVRIEVVNAAMTAVNSHVVLPIARDCAEMDPDVFIVYMGNNEVIGPYGAGSIFGRRLTSLPLIRAHIWLHSTKLAQSFFSLFDWQGNQWGKVQKWEGMAAFSDHKVAADDPRLQHVYDHFQRNLEDICRVGTGAGAHVLGCTVAVNSRDIPPFLSVHRGFFTRADLARFKPDFNRGLEHLDHGEWGEAVNAFAACVEEDDRHADAHYWLAKAMQAYGEEPEAIMPHLLMATDLDALRYRADIRLNQIIRDVFSGPSDERCRLLDIEQNLAQAVQGSVNMPGDEFFYEHVHFTLQGNYQVAKALFEAIAPLVIDDMDPAPRDTFALPSAETCARRLGYTLLEQESYDRFMLEEMIANPPFTHQTRHAQRYAHKEAALAAKYDGRLTPGALRDAVAACEREVERNPDDLYLRRSLINHYLALEMRGKTIQQLEYMRSLMPNDYILLTKLAGEHMRLGNDEEAQGLFEQAIAINPYYHVAQNNLAVLEQRRRHRAQGIEIPEQEIIDPSK